MHTPLATVQITQDGLFFASGEPVRFKYLRNKERSPNFGSRFQQDIEPAGMYLTLDETRGAAIPANMERGEIEFKSPLVLAFTTDGPGESLYGHGSWKSRLHTIFGVRGCALTRKIRSLGYDSIVTVMVRDGAPVNTSEMMMLPEKCVQRRRKNPDSTPEEYRGQHQASDKSSGAPLWDVCANGIYPEDFYSYNGFRYYSADTGPGDSEAYGIVMSKHYAPNAIIKIYRAAPKNAKGINKGDWVTIARAYAKEHGEGALNGDYRIISKTVYARDLFTSGDSILEWGYDPQPRVSDQDRFGRMSPDEAKLRLERLGPKASASFRKALEERAASTIQRNPVPTIKTCSCGRSYTRATWQELPLAKIKGHSSGRVKYDEDLTLEFRHCPCKSTLTVEVQDEIERSHPEVGSNDPKRNPMAKKFTLADAVDAGIKLGVNWKTSKFSPEALYQGILVELEHRDVTRGGLLPTARIALAHLSECSDYYARLGPMEKACKAKAKRTFRVFTPARRNPVAKKRIAKGKAPVKLSGPTRFGAPLQLTSEIDPPYATEIEIARKVGKMDDRWLTTYPQIERDLVPWLAKQAAAGNEIDLSDLEEFVPGVDGLDEELARVGVIIEGNESLVLAGPGVGKPPPFTTMKAGVEWALRAIGLKPSKASAVITKLEHLPLEDGEQNANDFSEWIDEVLMTKGEFRPDEAWSLVEKLFEANVILTGSDGEHMRFDSSVSGKPDAVQVKYLRDLLDKADSVAKRKALRYAINVFAEKGRVAASDLPAPPPPERPKADQWKRIPKARNYNNQARPVEDLIPGDRILEMLKEPQWATIVSKVEPEKPGWILVTAFDPGNKVQVAKRFKIGRLIAIEKEGSWDEYQDAKLRSKNPTEASYLNRLIRHYGVTDDASLGGYLLPDGSFLDFSEGSGSRAQDHRNVTWVLPANWEGPRDSRWDGLVRVCKRTGMYRWMPESWSIEGWTPPTRSQVERIKELAKDMPLNVELHNGKQDFSRSYETHERGQVHQDIEDFFSGSRRKNPGGPVLNQAAPLPARPSRDEQTFASVVSRVHSKLSGRRRANPDDGDAIETAVDALGDSLQAAGVNLGRVPEARVAAALMDLGVEEGDIGTASEDLASWG